MRMNNLQKTREAYAELDTFINLLDEKDKAKIPNKLREFFKKEKDKNYKKEINVNIPIEEQNLREETLALIALLYLRYLCENEEEKSRLKSIYAENERKYQAKIKEQYDPEKILQERNKVEIKSSANNEEKALVEYKESIIKKIINKIKKIFKFK